MKFSIKSRMIEIILMMIIKFKKINLMMLRERITSLKY